MKNENTMCSVLELGISGDSYALVKNVCEDAGVIAVDKDTMSIILDVYEDVIADSPAVDLKLETNEVLLDLEGTGEEKVLFGYIKCGEAAADINSLVEEFDDEGESEGESEEESWQEDDHLSFVIAVGDISDEIVGLIQGQLNTHIAKESLRFEEGDLVNMTLTRLGEYHLD